MRPEPYDIVMDRKAEEEEARDLCPRCQIDRNQVREMLKEDTESDNFWQAIHILHNCRACLKVIKEEMWK